VVEEVAAEAEVAVEAAAPAIMEAVMAIVTVEEGENVDTCFDYFLRSCLKNKLKTSFLKKNFKI
jgi:hypothetical protein